MDPTITTALATLLPILGAGVWAMIKRADARNDAKTKSVISLLEDRVENLKGFLRREQKNVAILTGLARKYREQLLQNDIEPDPKDWPELEEVREDA